MRRNAENFVNYQDRAKKFSVGDIVAPFGLLESWTGKVTAVWPGIGMVDVETSLGNKRYPAESLQEYIDGNAAPPTTDSTPGGDYWTRVPTPRKSSAQRVASAYIKKSFFDKGAIYWADADRKYRLTKLELESEAINCPRCDEDSPLERAIYKRRSGKSERLLGCKSCLFLIKDADIINLVAGSKSVGE